MHTQHSRTDSSFSPFSPGLKFESTQPDYNPSDPPDGGGGTGGGDTTPSEPAQPADPPEESSGTS